MRKSTKFHQMPIIVIIAGDVVEKNTATKRRKRLEDRLDLYPIDREYITVDFALAIILPVSLVLMTLIYVMVSTL